METAFHNQGASGQLKDDTHGDNKLNQLLMVGIK